ncbi:LRR RECEPTOR-LIKE SERINE/THREONINE-PROTEIN KINASE-RELATED [Salix purpurea]|uniref:LRR RECEPTOR-LIKE SERINE/THREONINE-PROTEIN KINASE-RELATED n=1 Tax=Salix purpurea TaxID=77065 RepID=A0A9Q0V9F5_SALPP|nr:LRR RECEPTOR-LIKE SERINE/THREONINE-PROTEIN KINASE-RELATED [Salix purpurea]
MQKLGLCNYLSLSSNMLTGEVPNWIGELNRLETLDLSGNRFLGQVPTSIGNLQLLKVLNLSANGLSGSLPESMANCGNLLALDFSQNLLSGDLPTWIFGSRVEKVLHLENKLSGKFSSAPKLQVLDLSRNDFSGMIASSIGVLRNLQFLNLSKNSLFGPVPGTFGDLKELYVLDLSDNKLNGSIPTEIGGAFALKELRMERNSLSGQIPDSIGNCSSLMSLILSQNNLAGAIPAAMAKLGNLIYVDLSFNSLIGSLPKQLANLPSLISFNISHNNLQVNKTCPAVLPKPIVLNPNSSSDSTPGSFPQNPGHKRIILSISALIAIGDGFSDSPTTDANSGKLVMFTGRPDFSTGAHALLNKDCELGRGGFGAVYRTVLRDGHPVAIKKLTVSSLVKSQEDFEREVKKLGKIRHQNLVALEGYYWTQSLQLLIYEFVSGGSLYKHLHEGSGGHFLSWNERFNIILGTAKSLAHLHQSNIIHYNIKSSNVLIDSSEFACRTVKITEKCDVYGFGVLVLEIVTGKRPVEYMEDDVVVLCDMVRGALEEGRVEECVDGRLMGNFPADEVVPVMKLGLICTLQVPSNRPDMGEVINILDLIRCPSEGQEESG